MIKDTPKFDQFLVSFFGGFGVVFRSTTPRGRSRPLRNKSAPGPQGRGKGRGFVCCLQNQQASKLGSQQANRIGESRNIVDWSITDWRIGEDWGLGIGDW